MKTTITLNPKDNGGEAVLVSLINNEEYGPSLEIETACYGVHSTSMKLHNVDIEALKTLQFNIAVFINDVEKIKNG